MNKKWKRDDLIVRSLADSYLPIALVLGFYVILHGNISPGGGFQGGVLVASAILLVYLGYGGWGVKHSFNEHMLHSSETVAEIMYVVIALVGVFTGLNFCVNFVFAGQQVDTSILMNDAVGYHVMAGITCLLIMMLSVLEDDKHESPEEKEEDAA